MINTIVKLNFEKRATIIVLYVNGLGYTFCLEDKEVQLVAKDLELKIRNQM